MHVVEDEDGGGGDEGAEGDADDVGDGHEGGFFVAVEAGLGVVGFLGGGLVGWGGWGRRETGLLWRGRGGERGDGGECWVGIGDREQLGGGGD